MARKLVECSFLVPIHRDPETSDGAPHEQENWYWLVERLFDLFGAWTLAPGVYEGVWKSPQGTAIPDQTRRYTVAIARKQVPQLRRLLVEVCEVFQQQAIYVSVGGEVEFIERSPDDSSA